MYKDGIHVLARAVIIDQDNILLCQTLDLPVSFYFLPGGHVEHEESASSALIRELLEETGARNVQIKRFLGILEHSFEPGFSSICHNHEYNLIFEVESEKLKIDSEIPKIENHIQTLWMPVKDIINIDFRPEPLKNLILKWLQLNYNDSFYSSML